MKDKNKYLNWIRKNKSVLSINSLERHIGLPALTLHHYHQTGNFPPAHLALLNTKMAKLLQHGTSPLVTYVADRISLYRARIKAAQALGGPVAGKEIKAKNDQLFDDIMALYLLVQKKDPLLGDMIYKELSALKSPAIDEITVAMKAGRLPTREILDNCKKEIHQPGKSPLTEPILRKWGKNENLFPKEKK